MLIRFPLFLASALLVCAPVQLRAQSPGSVQLWLVESRKLPDSLNDWRSFGRPSKRGTT